MAFFAAGTGGFVNGGSGGAALAGDEQLPEALQCGGGNAVPGANCKI
jgi:hypothetical protein